MICVNLYISAFNFIPLVGAPSILRLSASIPRSNSEINFEEIGSIKQLSEKFGFKIESEQSWDFTGFIGRECNVRKDENGYHFIYWLDSTNQ